MSTRAGGRSPALHVGVDLGREGIGFELSGDLDFAAADDLEALFDATIDRGHLSIVVDLRDLRFIDSAGCEVLRAAAARLSWSGAPLVVRNPAPGVLRILGLCGLHRLIELDLESGDADRAAFETQWSHRLNDLLAEGPDGLGILRNTEGRVSGADESIQAALDLVVTVVGSTVEGVDAASIRLLRDGRLRTAAATENWTTESADHSGSMLAVPIVVGYRPIGALNLCSDGTSGFARHAHDLAAQFAAQIARIVGGAEGGSGPSVEVLGAQLRGNLDRQREMAHAEGLFVGRLDRSEGGTAPHR